MQRNLTLIIAALLLFSVLFVSCTSTMPAGSSAADDSRKISSRESEEITERPEKIEITGAIDFREPEFSDLLDTRPRNGRPVFFAAVTRLFDREDEYDFGVRLLARQAAIFSEAKVSARTLTVSTSRYEGAREQIEVDYREDLLNSLKDRIEVTDYYTDNRGTYLKGTLRGISLPDFEIPALNSGDVPVWFNRMPEYSGFLTSVGVSQRQMFFAESLLESEKQTIANMARQFNIGIEKKRDDVEIDGVGSAYKQQNIEIVDVNLKGFYILDRRISADGNTYYTLAVAPLR